VTPPVFVTEVEGRIVATDLPPKLLSDSSASVLRALASVNGNVEYLAARVERSVRWVWDDAVSASEELRATSVDDAVALMRDEQSVAEPAPAVRSTTDPAIEEYRRIAEARYTDMLYNVGALFEESIDTPLHLELA
jgi:hypothetical protein